MEKRKVNYKNMLKESTFGQLFSFWTAPIDKPKISNSWFPNNLIIAHRP